MSAATPTSNGDTVNYSDLAFCLGLCLMMAPLCCWPIVRTYASAFGLHQQVEVKSLEQILQDPEAHHTFKDFLTSEFSVENLMFYEAVQEFQEDFEADIPNENQELAQRIYNDFIAVGSPFQVNLPATVVSPLAQMLRPQLLSTSPIIAQHIQQQRMQQIHQNIFDEAVRNILELMKRDSYQRFIRSRYYRKLDRQRQSKLIVDRTLFEVEMPNI